MVVAEGEVVRRRDAAALVCPRARLGSSEGGEVATSGPRRDPSLYLGPGERSSEEEGGRETEAVVGSGLALECTSLVHDDGGHRRAVVPEEGEGVVPSEEGKVGRDLARDGEVSVSKGEGARPRVACRLTMWCCLSRDGDVCRAVVPSPCLGIYMYIHTNAYEGQERSEGRAMATGSNPEEAGRQKLWGGSSRAVRGWKGGNWPCSGRGAWGVSYWL